MKRDLEINGYVIGQWPNAPLWLAIAGMTGSAVFETDSTAHDYSEAATYIGLSVWAWLELTEGVNNWRRLLGLGGLAFVGSRLAAAL